MNQDYYDEQYEDWDEYDDDEDYGYYDDDFEDYGYNYYDGDDYTPSRWQRLKAWFNRLYWRIRLKLQPNINQFDDIPF